MPPFKLSPLKTSQLPELSRGFNQVFKQYLPWTIRLEHHFAPSYVPENRAFTCVALDGKKIAAHASGKAYGVRVGDARITWSSYGNVMTLPEYRGKGLASRINARLWSRMKKDGVDGVYISGGRGLYTRAGATFSGRNFQFTLKASQLKAGTQGLSLKKCGPSDLPTLLRLQHSDPVAFERGERDFRTTLSHGIAYLGKCQAWLLLSSGKPLAWLALNPAKRAKLTDYAGPRSAVLAGLRLASKKLSFKEVELSVAGHDEEFLRLLGGKGKFALVEGTHLILDPQRLFKRLKPYFEQQLGKEGAKGLAFKMKGKGFEVKLGSKRTALKDLPALTKFVFGNKANVAGPFKSVFPIPFPIIGLNWT
jgi:hypothetical protein